METDKVTIEQFIERNRISLKADWTDHNPNMADSENMDHWKVTLARKDAVPRRTASGVDLLKNIKTVARMTLYFSRGYGNEGKDPTAEEVLDCLASDAAGIENAAGLLTEPDFEDWCSEYGFEADSRKAEQTFKACVHQARRLKTFLGDELYAQLLWDIERG